MTAVLYDFAQETRQVQGYVDNARYRCLPERYRQRHISMLPTLRLSSSLRHGSGGIIDPTAVTSTLGAPSSTQKLPKLISLLII
jgi:hypothetical protein